MKKKLILKNNSGYRIPLNITLLVVAVCSVINSKTFTHLYQHIRKTV